MTQRKDMDGANMGNKGNTQAMGRGEGETSSVGSYYAIRKYCLDRKVKAFSYDEFDDRAPRPKKKNEPGGPKIVVRKSSTLRKKQSEEESVPGSSEDSHDKSNKSTQALPIEDVSEVQQLEKQLVQLMSTISRVTVQKSSYQDLLKQMYYNIEDLIKIDPLKAKSPLSTELQKAYDTFRAMD